MDRRTQGLRNAYITKPQRSQTGEKRKENLSPKKTPKGGGGREKRREKGASPGKPGKERSKQVHRAGGIPKGIAKVGTPKNQSK